MVGRITEEHLSEADKTFPGIAEMYEGLSKKPKTFLQLVWLYEATRLTDEHDSVAGASAVG